MKFNKDMLLLYADFQILSILLITRSSNLLILTYRLALQ